MANKSDLEPIDINSLNDFVQGTPVPAEQIDDNNSVIVSNFNTVVQILEDQMPQTGVATEYTAEQDFQQGILTDSIGNSSTNSDIDITITGVGVAQITDGTFAAGRILTTTNINTLAPGGAVVMTGATSVANGASGLAPQPLAGEQNDALMGDATWRPVVRSTADILNTGAIAAGQSLVGTGANATAPDYVPTIAAAFDVSTAAAAGKAIIASSSSAGTWDFVPTVAAAFDVTGAAAAGKAIIAGSSSSGDWDFVPTIANAFDVTGTPAAGQGIVASSSSAGTFDYVVTAPAAMDISNSGTNGYVLTATGANGAQWSAFASGIVGLVAQGRLTLETGVPVSTTAQTAKSTIYYTPYVGNVISLWDGASWVPTEFTETSVAVPATTVTPFDIFAYDNAGTLALETLNWTSDTTRATAVSYQDGVLCKTGDKTRRLLGTGRTTGVSGQTQQTSTGGSWLLSDVTTPLLRPLFANGLTGSWTDSASGYRAANANTTVGTTRVEFVLPVASYVEAFVLGEMTGSGANADGGLGVGIDSTSVNSAQTYLGAVNTTTAKWGNANYSGYLAAGYHYIQWLEAANGTDSVTYKGSLSDGVTYATFGLKATVLI